jgi:hypothetical protein
MIPTSAPQSSQSLNKPDGFREWQAQNTPQTEKNLITLEQMLRPLLHIPEMVPSNFARTLERANAALVAELAILRNYSRAADELTALRSANAELAATLSHCKGMFLMCRDHFAECDEDSEGMPSWAKMCLDEILKINYALSTHAAQKAGGA